MFSQKQSRIITIIINILYVKKQFGINFFCIFVTNYFCFFRSRHRTTYTWNEYSDLASRKKWLSMGAYGCLELENKSRKKGTSRLCNTQFFNNFTAYQSFITEIVM